MALSLSRSLASWIRAQGGDACGSLPAPKELSRARGDGRAVVRGTSVSTGSVGAGVLCSGCWMSIGCWVLGAFPAAGAKREQQIHTGR